MTTATDLVPLEERSTPVVITSDQVAVIKDTLCKDATPAEMQLFFYDCRRRGVHPLDRLIHFTKRTGKYTPVTSIDFFRSRAGDTGEHMGTEDAVFDYNELNADVPIRATVRVYRWVKGEKCAFVASARMREYMPAPGSDFMWRRMPMTMLGKCAEALALRKAFPQQLSGLYIVEEMDQAEEAPAPKRPPAKAEPPAEAVITQAQRTRLFTLATKAGWTEDGLKQWLLWVHRLESTKDIPKAKYDEICAAIEQGPVSTMKSATPVAPPKVAAPVVQDLDVDEVF